MKCDSRMFFHMQLKSKHDLINAILKSCTELTFVLQLECFMFWVQHSDTRDFYLKMAWLRKHLEQLSTLMESSIWACPKRETWHHTYLDWHAVQWLKHILVFYRRLPTMIDVSSLEAIIGVWICGFFKDQRIDWPTLFDNTDPYSRNIVFYEEQFHGKWELT